MNNSFLCYPMIDSNMEVLPRKAFDNESINKNATNKEFHDCHLQKRNKEFANITMPTEYQQQYVYYNAEKAHSIPQRSHFKMHGDFYGVPEYNDNYKKYDNYSKSAPIKKHDHLLMSGSECLNMNKADDEDQTIPEYREKFKNPFEGAVRQKSLKHLDHLKSEGIFTNKTKTTYLESFRDPEVKLVPERGKCREPYLRLKGKIEFNPEYRNTYLDFPRARPVVKKPTTSLRLPISNSTSDGTTTPKESFTEVITDPDEITSTPEYRRASYHYQIRERVSPRNTDLFMARPKGKETVKDIIEAADTSRNRNSRRQTNSNSTSIATQTKFDGSLPAKSPAKFGRRASLIRNAKNRESTCILEANPKYRSTDKRKNLDSGDAFVVLDEPKNRISWLQK